MAYSLYLYPEGAKSGAGSTTDLAKLLIAHRFMSAGPEAKVFQPGEQLMAYINFLGCSPSLASGNLHATIVIHEFECATVMGGKSIETIRYPKCRHPVQQKERLLKNLSLNTRLICTQCGSEYSFEQINWRKSAGLSTLFLEISPIFPKEALPGEELLSLLQQFKLCSWSWFYSESSSRIIYTDL